ncbi:MAG: hypothetical protein HYR85_07075 [Planctomycetes bacterium]|nr:hypothetical protein [Planctomycetota bacterium]MBI3843849.1 hypothetical protein [Planctomycetota bacterium]
MRSKQRQSVFIAACTALLFTPWLASADQGIQLTPATEWVSLGASAVIDVTVDPALVGQDLVFARSRRLGATRTGAGYLPLGGDIRREITVHVTSTNFQVTVPAVYGPYLAGRTYVLAACTTDGVRATAVSNPIGAVFDTDSITLSQIPLPEGIGWSAQSSGTTYALNHVAFPDRNNGWIAGVPHGLLHTVNGGATWRTEILDPNLPVTPTVVEFADALNGWASATFFTGIIWSTTDGGLHWRSGAAIHAVNAMHFVDSLTGWVVGVPPTLGAGGPISRTVDGGRSWTNQATTLDAELYGVDFTTSRRGFAVGRHGLILATTDGGSTWVRRPVPTEFADTFFLGIEAVGGVGVWVVGQNGTILFSSDGVNFLPQSSGTTATLRSVSFVTNLNGWVTGDDGTVLATFDGGTTWVPFDAGTDGRTGSNIFLHVDGRNQTSAWAVGVSGLIRRFGILP